MISIRKHFLIGFLVILPLASLLWLIDVAIQLLTGPIAQLFGIQLTGSLGVVVSVLVIWAVGALVHNMISRSIFAKLEALIIRVPILRVVYHAMRQIAGVVMNKKQRFLATVFIEYPSKGIWSLGFLTNDHVPAMKTTQGMTLVQKPVAVFIPSTPNPTNGIFVFVNAADIHQSNMSVEDGIKCLMSAGMITPKDFA
jgi:uncharacterized membrane protein